MGAHHFKQLEMADATLLAGPTASSYRTVADPKNYMVACDGSDPSRHAVNYLLGIVRPGTDTVTLVTVAEPLPEDNAEKRRKIEKAVESTLHFYMLKLCEVGVAVEARPLHTSESAGKALCDEAERSGANYFMVVIGCRGLGAVKRKLLGSVSDFVSKNCAIPVLIVQ
eukprot:Amastigsp_a841903_1230.p1 type:complete len:168 gc:universal Amastigsp_a841903_1230:583-80(-)